jgi:hypothetical protein
MPTSDIKKGPLYVDSTNNRVGIKTVAPDLALHVEGTNAAPASSGSTSTGFVSLRQKDGGSSHGANIGVLGVAPWGTWIQGQDANNLATSYPLLLNPNGGSVGIGTSSPAQPLEIVSSTFAYARKRSTNGSYIGFDVGQHQSGQAVLNLRDNNFMQFLTNDIERLRIDASGRVTMPYQPSFAATRNQGDVSNAVYVYPNVYHNIGGHYNNSNGRFTAPVTGSYFISANHMTSNGATYNNYEYQIRINGSAHQLAYSSSGGNVHHRWNWHGVIHLQAGDYVDVFIGSGFVIYGQSNLYQHFSGYLIG